MAAEVANIEEFADGTAAFVSARESAWHRLGTVLPRGLTAEDVLVTGKLGGWDVRKDENPVQGQYGPVDGQYAISRKHPVTGFRENLGVVGSTYVPIQNEHGVGTLNTIKDESEGEFETAGSLYGGRRVFVTTKLGRGVLLGGKDAVDKYLVYQTSHDGSLSATISVSNVRVVCANTFRANLRGYVTKYTLRHTESATAKLADIRQALDLTFAYDEAFEAEAEKLLNESYTEAQFNELVSQLWDVPDADATARAKGISQRRNLELVSLFTDNPRQTEIAGTRWAAYNAIVDYEDWATPVRQPTADAIRALRTVNDTSNASRIKERAFALLQV
jgi:phage/plasmid-like protein (TIGR03299 family)